MRDRHLLIKRLKFTASWLMTMRKNVASVYKVSEEVADGDSKTRYRAKSVVSDRITPTHSRMKSRSRCRSAFESDFQNLQHVTDGHGETKKEISGKNEWLEQLFEIQNLASHFEEITEETKSVSTTWTLFVSLYLSCLSYLVV